MSTSQTSNAATPGPRTPAGKARAAQNSLRHGMLARGTVVRGEDASEYQFHLEGLRDAFQPADAHEDALVSRLATLSWRLARAQRVEVGLFEDHRMNSDGTDSGIGIAFLRDSYASEAFLKLARYESSVERSYWRTLDALERRRAARKPKTIEYTTTETNAPV